jgi:hypothetical protein
MAESSQRQKAERLFIASELMSPESISTLRDIVADLERSGADPKCFIGFCCRHTDWTFVRRTGRIEAE